MRIQVRIKIKSKTPGVFLQDDGSYEVGVNALPKDGKANAELVTRLADFFDTPKSNISIMIGHRSRDKVVNIAGL